MPRPHHQNAGPSERMPILMVQQGEQCCNQCSRQPTCKLRSSSRERPAGTRARHGASGQMEGSSGTYAAALQLQPIHAVASKPGALSRKARRPTNGSSEVDYPGKQVNKKVNKNGGPPDRCSSPRSVTCQHSCRLSCVSERSVLSSSTPSSTRLHGNFGGEPVWPRCSSTVVTH